MTSSTAEVFIDTSGFYASLVKKDTHHDEAQAFFQRASQQGLLKRRRFPHLLAVFFETIFSSQACRISWTDASLFKEAVDFMLKHADKGRSFTDCLSFVVMQQEGISQALTSDIHFDRAGLQRLVKKSGCLAPPFEARSTGLGR